MPPRKMPQHPLLTFFCIKRDKTLLSDGNFKAVAGNKCPGHSFIFPLPPVIGHQCKGISIPAITAIRRPRLILSALGCRCAGIRLNPPYHRNLHGLAAADDSKLSGISGGIGLPCCREIRHGLNLRSIDLRNDIARLQAGRCCGAIGVNRIERYTPWAICVLTLPAVTPR